MNTKTAVEILGLHEANLSEKSIKSAYRKLAIENHPDLFPNDTKRETRMKDINNAYDFLCLLIKDGQLINTNQYEVDVNSQSNPADMYDHPGYSHKSVWKERAYNHSAPNHFLFYVAHGYSGRHYEG